MSNITIGFVPRERFSLAAESLKRIFDHTHLPFNLIIVNCNIPSIYWKQIEQVLVGRQNVTIIHREEYLLPNQSKNLVIQEAKDDFLCLIENDNLVKDGWLKCLQNACDDYPADVVVPLIIEGPLSAGKVHFDDLLGTVKPVETSSGRKWEIVPRTDIKELDWGSTERRKVYFMEQHCLYFRREIFDRIGFYDETLNTRDEIDISLALLKVGAEVVFEPKCEIHYIPPYPPNEDELDYFFMKWNLEHAEISRARIQEKWNLINVPGDMEFVRDRNRIGYLSKAKKELQGILGEDNPSFILIDQAQWLGTEITKGLNPIPFTENEGQYWGPPKDDNEAIEELERLRNIGASHLVFIWHTFWWLDYYSGFFKYLESKFNRIMKNDLLIVFELT